MQQLRDLFEQWAGEPCQECLALGANASHRRYFRLVGEKHRCIGAINDDLRENEAFFAYSRHLYDKGIHVPQLYLVSDDRRLYLQQDLGDTTLYNVLLEKKRHGGGFDAEMMSLYRKALADLAAMQLAGRDLDFSVSYPRIAFDRRSIFWDLNYFKYFFLKLTNIPFDEELLENDFEQFTDFLLSADCSYFLYRDFQSRNIMVVNRELYYIDYQGGRRGASQYDVASLLYSAKSDMPEPLRQELLTHYLKVRGIEGKEMELWLQMFWGYVLVRIMQAMGAYGYRGLYEQKPYFSQSIPLAISNLRYIIENHRLPVSLHELEKVWQRIAETQAPVANIDNRLTIHVNSFSYKHGLPVDKSDNGGGYIFDCRALPNPGRYPEYQTYTGRDRYVKDFFADPTHKPVMDRFLSDVEDILAQSIDKYIERHFTSLMVSFGCTGGQHRSVFCAEQIACWIGETYSKNKVIVVLHHREQE